MAHSDEVIRKVWEKARGMTELSPEPWRSDECGAWIRRDHYGQTRSAVGGKIETVSVGGPDTVEDLRAFHHADAYDRSGRHARCHVTADQTDIPVTGHVREPRNRPK